MSGTNPPPPNRKAPEAPGSPAPSNSNSNELAESDQNQFAAAVQQSYDSLGGTDNLNKRPAAGSVVRDSIGGVGAPPDPRSNITGSPTPPTSDTARATISASPSLKKPSHGRTVSWGVSSISPIPMASSHRNRPPLPSWDGTGVSSAASRARARAHTNANGSPVNVKKQDLDISDVLNAGVHTEMEAETYILQAVEKYAAPGTHQSTDTATSRLYSNIAEDEIQSCIDQSSVTAVSAQSSPSSPRSGGAKSPGRPAPPSKQQSSRFQGIVKKQMAKGPDSVEATLFGLTSALAQLDGSTGNSTNKHRRGMSSARGGGLGKSSRHVRDDSIAYDSNFTAADKLANTAQDILQGKDDTGLPANQSGAASQSNNNGAPKTPDTTGAMSNEEDISTSRFGDSKRSSSRMSSGGRRNRSIVKGASDGAKQEWGLFNTYFTTRKAKMRAYMRKICMIIMLPSFGIAFFLFYIVENPELCNAQSDVTMAPTMTPSMEPSMYPSMAPSEFEPWTLSWGAGNATSSSSATNISALVNETVGPTAAPATEAPVLQDFLVCPGLGASVSWWFLFLGVRQVLTFTLALVTQSLIIDYLALSSRICLDWLGPYVTLLIVQSKGWPFIVIFWAVFDLVLLSGDRPFTQHWGYWQDRVGLFNEDNPSGNVVSNDWNYTILVNAIFIGCAVAVKRVVVGLMLGRSTYVHYGEQLARVMKNMVLVGEVATLGKQIENEKEDFRETYAAQMNMSSTAWSPTNIQAIVNKEADEDDMDETSTVVGAADAANAFMANREASNEANTNTNHAVNTSVDSVLSMDSATLVDPEFTKSQHLEMSELLDAWEEPITVEEQVEKNVTIGAMMQFRQALTFMKKKYPFLPDFGPADTREVCIDSAQRLYERLLLRTPLRDEIPFETLALLAKDESGRIDQEKAKDLIRAFRPDRDGSLGKLEFVKSIDVIYKALRLLSANISNSSYMDAAVENLVNVVFYVVLVAVIIYRLGQNPVSFFLSFSSVILAFAFMIGKSASKYFDGCLFILVQRPYGVGDRMHLSNPQNDTSSDGSSGWIVESISLFTTSVYWGATNERATLCNGAISSLRVINAARSPNAVVYVPLKFGIDTEYEKIEIFKSAVEHYLKDRPREWLCFSGFRPTEVASDRGFIGYKIIAQHRNSWQAIGGIVESKANLTTYCLEVSKQLDMRYHAPSLPVDLTVKDGSIDLPVLPDNPSMDEYSLSSVASPSASPGDAKSALAAINAGLRQRKAKTNFADLVRMAMEQNKDK